RAGEHQRISGNGWVEFRVEPDLACNVAPTKIWDDRSPQHHVRSRSRLEARRHGMHNWNRQFDRVISGKRAVYLRKRSANTRGEIDGCHPISSKQNSCETRPVACDAGVSLGFGEIRCALAPTTQLYSSWL